MVDNYFRLVGRNLKLNAFTASWFQASVVFPYALVAPFYFAGTLSLGQLQQTAGAFSGWRVRLSFFISRYASLANYKAIVDRPDDLRRCHRQGAGDRPHAAASRTWRQHLVGAGVP